MVLSLLRKCLGVSYIRSCLGYIVLNMGIHKLADITGGMSYGATYIGLPGTYFYVF